MQMDLSFASESSLLGTQFTQMTAQGIMSLLSKITGDATVQCSTHFGNL